MTSWHELKVRALGASPARCPDTGLTPIEEDQRNEACARWIQRIQDVMNETGCSAYQALKAIETSTEETP